MKRQKENQIENELTALIEVVQTLRSDDGCPWDRKQTPLSLVKYIKEETSELIEAIESDDPENICEELGDVFYLLVMISQYCAEKELFQLKDSLVGVREKLIRRHPHVFGDVKISDEQELREQWQAIKLSEKKK